MSPEERARLIQQAMAVQMNLLGYLKMCDYPYYIHGPCDLEVWVPARYYHIARLNCGNMRSIGTRVTVMVDSL